MKIAITGATGLIGSALSVALTESGATVVAATRRASQGALVWDPTHGFAQPLSGFDAVFHLAGAGIASARWTDATMQEIRDSRVLGTQAVVQAIARANPRPHTLVTASGVDYYGDRGDMMLDETSQPGEGFLAEVVIAWEREALAARELGVRSVVTRFGMVLAGDRGALPELARPFRFGVGGRMGSGRQWIPWIHVRDAVGALLHVLVHSELVGPINVVTPHPVTNAEFAHTLGKVLRRPAFFPAPAFALRMVAGKMAGPLLLASKRVVPERLCGSGYAFAFAKLAPALEDLLVAARFRQ